VKIRQREKNYYLLVNVFSVVRKITFAKRPLSSTE